MKNKNSLNIISVILCTFIGAGFASGKEIYNFFGRFGIAGILGIFLSGVLTGLIIFITIKISKNFKIENNVKFMEKIKAPGIMYNIVNIFLLISFYIMIAGFAGYFKQEFNISLYIASGVLCFLLYIALINQIEGIVKINTYIAPILLSIMIYVCIKYGKGNENIIYENVNWERAIFNAVLYSSYNSIILIPILVSLSKFVNSKKENVQISALSALIIIILTFGIYQVLINSNLDISTIELPVVAIIDNKVEKVLYSIAIETAIFTSAISAGYGVLENLSKRTKENRKKYRFIVGLICILGIPISAIGFGNLVNTLYPVFGVLGLVQIILMFKVRKKI